MEVNIVNKTHFGTTVPFSRFDAEFVWKSLWDIEKAIRANEGWTLSDLVSQYSGPTLNDAYLNDDSPVEYVDIDSVDASDGLTYADQILYRDRPSRAKYKVHQGDLLVSNVRPNRGAIAYVGKVRNGALASSGFTLLRDKKQQSVPQSYLFAFLKSRFGRTQLKRRCRGSMYPAVTSSDLLDIWVPKPPEAALTIICNAVERGRGLQDRFFELVDLQAEVLEKFLKPFGCPPSPLHGDITKANWTEISRNDVVNAERFDAEFFRHEYQTFDSKLKSSISTFALGDYYDLAAGRGLGNGDEVIPFLKQGMLTNAGVNWSALSYEVGGSRSPGNVQAGDILLACTAHEVYYVGRKVDFVREVPEKLRQNNSAVADLIVMRPLVDKPAHLYGSFVAAFLRSPSGLHQVQRCIRGLRGGHVYKDDLSKYVRVPIPTVGWLDAFEERAAAYESVRAQANQEMAKAFGCVEEWLAASCSQ